jgi:hypothetical protein
MNIPASAPVAFDCLGFFEDFWIEGKFLGSRPVAWPTRPFGAAGQKEVELTAPLELTRGLKPATIKASKTRPVRCYSVLNMKCGKQLKVGDIVKVRRSEIEARTSLAPDFGKIEAIVENGRAALSHGCVEWKEDVWRLQLIEGKP